jgi:hypothetical protein
MGATPAQQDEVDLLLRALIDEEYTRRPFYGSRRMVVFLRARGHRVNRKRVQRLMRELGLAGMAPGPATSRAHPKHKVWPYLLRGVAITRPDQVWSTDVTYIRLARGFAYLVAVIDWYSRRVLSWRISNSMDASFCVDCLEDALRAHGKPDVFNSDQGSQFGVDPLSWTPILFKRRSPPWQSTAIHTRPNSGPRSWSWSEPDVRPRNWPRNSSRPRKPSTTGWRRPIAMPASAKTA